MEINKNKKNIKKKNNIRISNLLSVKGKSFKKSCITDLTS